MTGASIEATLELWTSSLRGVKERTRPLFAQEQVAASAGASWTACLAMSGARRLLLGGHGDDPNPPRIADTRFPGFRSLALILAQALNAAFPIAFLPAPDRGL